MNDDAITQVLFNFYEQHLIKNVVALQRVYTRQYQERGLGAMMLFFESLEEAKKMKSKKIHYIDRDELMGFALAERLEPFVKEHQKSPSTGFILTIIIGRACRCVLLRTGDIDVDDSKRCWYSKCNRLGSNLSACSRCTVAEYCSKACQVADWKLCHAEICK